MKNLRLNILLIILVLIIGPVFLHTFKVFPIFNAFYPNEGKYKVYEDRAVFQMGEIADENLYTRFYLATEKILQSNIKEIVLDLNSPGGYEETSIMIVIYLELLKQRGIKITTYVGENKQCNSACTAIFSHGDRRVVSKSAKFVFHYGTPGSNMHPGRAAELFEDIKKHHMHSILNTQIFKLCGSNNTISKNIMDRNNATYKYAAGDLEHICPSYITEIVD